MLCAERRDHRAGEEAGYSGTQDEPEQETGDHGSGAPADRGIDPIGHGQRRGDPDADE